MTKYTKPISHDMALECAWSLYDGLDYALEGLRTTNPKNKVLFQEQAQECFDDFKAEHAEKFAEYFCMDAANEK